MKIIIRLLIIKPNTFGLDFKRDPSHLIWYLFFIYMNFLIDFFLLIMHVFHFFLNLLFHLLINQIDNYDDMVFFLNWTQLVHNLTGFRIWFSIDLLHEISIKCTYVSLLAVIAWHFYQKQINVSLYFVLIIFIRIS